MHHCHKCGTEWIAEKKRPGFKDFCASCSAYLHSCKNCHFYDPSAHNSCRIGTTEFVPDKSRGNFCDEFEFAQTDKSTDILKKIPGSQAFDNLFGGTLPGEEEEQKPSDFDSLFGD